jgi:hypothetical protein
MDGGFIAIADISDAMRAIGASNDYRLIGGVAVLLHVQRLGLDLPLRATGDADFGVPPHLLRGPELVTAIEALGYTKVAGNRWERHIDDRRVASVDLLIPAYTSHARHTRQVGDIVTTEVPGLAVAPRRPAVAIPARFRLTSGDIRDAIIALPDPLGMLTLKALVRTVRHEDRDAQDLWRCLEVAVAEGITPEIVAGEPGGAELRALLHRELGPNGTSLDAITGDLQANAAARLRTRIRSLLAEVAGVP